MNSHVACYTLHQPSLFNRKDWIPLQHVQVATCSVDCVDYASPLEFDPVYYNNSYGDLNVFKTLKVAKQHWLSKGISESRQGSGNFHSKQYLHRYQDLSKAYGYNYKAAIEHYVEHSHHEHRLGYVAADGTEDTT